MFYPFPGDAANLQMNDSVNRIVIGKEGYFFRSFHYSSRDSLIIR